jgi:hypothetical protein
MVGVQKRIHVATLRADAWWAHLADWYVPEEAQTDRDRVGDTAPSASAQGAKQSVKQGAAQSAKRSN